MSGASDISNLFDMAGVSPMQYQEVEDVEQKEGVRGRWASGPALPVDTLFAASDVPLPERVPAETTMKDVGPAEVAEVVSMQASDAPLAEKRNDAAERLAAWHARASMTEAPTVFRVERDDVSDAATETAVPVETAPAAAPAPTLSRVFARLLDQDDAPNDGPHHMR